VPGWVVGVGCVGGWVGSLVVVGLVGGWVGGLVVDGLVGGFCVVWGPGPSVVAGVQVGGEGNMVV